MDTSNDMIVGLLGPLDAEQAAVVIKWCRLTQFEADIWNALNHQGDERRSLVKSAHESLYNPKWTTKPDPTKAVPAFWQATQNALKAK